MGRRDFSWRETKKPKQGAKKLKPISELIPQPEVQVVKKKKKEEPIEEE